MVDIDHFKAYNDMYGHQKGDECLRAVAHAMQRVLRRPGDYLARYGGEEFVAVLPNTDTVGAMHVAKAIRDAVAALAIPAHWRLIAMSASVSGSPPSTRTSTPSMPM